MDKVLFLTNELYVDNSKREGGVRNCTNEFIELLKVKFDVHIFPVSYDMNLLYRVRVKLGINNYNDYAPLKYIQALKKNIAENKITHVFLNLSNTITFSKVLKDIDPGLKIILCSHGNETGDYLHQTVRFKNEMPVIKNLFSTWSLGKLLKKEAFFRYKYLDMVLSISEVEDNIEKWLGSMHTFMVPRTITPEPITLRPILNKVGFMGDLSHTPNYTGIISYCEKLSRIDHNIEFCLVGGPEHIGTEISKMFSFVNYRGYLNNDQLLEEVSQWCYFLNLVFYYSRGVSTKLAKAFSWGLPVITTVPGNRGYVWSEGQTNIAVDAADMVHQTITFAARLEKIKSDQAEVKKIVASSPTFESIMNDLYPQLLAL